MHPFRVAVESGDAEAAISLLADDVVFHSPVVFAPYRGRDSVAPILRAVFQVFQGFRYVREIGVDGAPDHALVFEASVGDKQLLGVDLLRCDESGVITELTVMVRPLSGALALAEAMRARLSST